MGERRGATRYWWGKLEGNGLVEKSRRRWAENKKMDLQEMGWRACIGLICLRVGIGECGYEPSSFMKRGELD